MSPRGQLLCNMLHNLSPGDILIENKLLELTIQTSESIHYSSKSDVNKIR